MTLGLAERQGRLGNVAVQRCEQGLPERSIYRLLHAERDRLFPDELFADLYVQHGRRSVPPSILAVVMVLQRLEGRCCIRDDGLEQRDCRHENAPTSPCSCPTLHLQRVPLPTRGHRDRGPLVPTLWSLLPRRRGTARRTGR